MGSIIQFHNAILKRSFCNFSFVDFAKIEKGLRFLWQKRIKRNKLFVFAKQKLAKKKNLHNNKTDKGNYVSPCYS